jgi:hypothetical protein
MVKAQKELKIKSSDWPAQCGLFVACDLRARMSQSRTLRTSSWMLAAIP